jgi:predicted nucleic acid-binding Zn ribbon protein
MDEPSVEQREAWDLAQIKQRRSRLFAKPIGSVVRRLMNSSGYGETKAAEQLQECWQRAVGAELARLSRPGNVSRGILLVNVANSAVMQEIHFRKKRVLAALRSEAVGMKSITDIRIRIARFD